MSIRSTREWGIHRALGAAAVACVLLLCVQTGARAQTVCRRFSDGGGRLLSITDTGNLIEFFTSRTAEHIFSGNVQEGFVVSYTSTTAYSVHDSFQGINVGTCSGTASGTFTAGTTATATVVNTTWDGRVRITSVFTWVAGTNSVRIDTTFRNIRTSGDIVFRTAKRFVDADVDRVQNNNFNTTQPNDAFATNPANNRRFTLSIVGAPAGATRSAYHADFRDADFAINDNRNAELGATTNENDVLVGFIDLRVLTGGGLTLAPGQEFTLSTTYTVS